MQLVSGMRAAIAEFRNSAKGRLWAATIPAFEWSKEVSAPPRVSAQSPQPKSPAPKRTSAFGFQTYDHRRQYNDSTHDGGQRDLFSEKERGPSECG